MSSPLISIISPVYQAEKIVDELVKRITDAVSTITNEYEIILIEDGSPDNSWQKIEENCNRTSKVKGIKFSRNFGQHYAITAGIEVARGSYIIVMDCDLQDDPIYIPMLYNKALEGYDIVFTINKKRKHHFWKNFTSRAFNAVFNYLVENKSWKANTHVGAYSLISAKAATAFKQFNDYQRHYLMVLRWIGFKNCYLEIEHNRRWGGESSYTLSKLLNLAISGITSQSDKLLKINIVTGLIISALSFAGLILIIILYFIHGLLNGWASSMVLILFATGIILTSVGITGIYVGKIFEQTKNRPKYIIDTFLNNE